MGVVIRVVSKWGSIEVVQLTPVLPFHQWWLCPHGTPCPTSGQHIYFTKSREASFQKTLAANPLSRPPVSSFRSSWNSFMIHIKNRSEIEKMRASGKIAARVLQETGALVKPGISTQELNDFAEKLTRKLGATSAPLNYKGFPRSICTSVNHVVCHGIPSPLQVLQDGDIINIDITVIYDGFHGETSRTFVGGEIRNDARTLMEDAERSLYVGIEAVHPGGRVSDIGDAIDGFLTPKGYGIVRDLTGHGIGRNFHEEPTVPHYAGSGARARLKPGMTFTIEPMVNYGGYHVLFSKEDGWTVTTRDGSLSAQYEHTLVVTEEGCEILTLPD